MMNNVISLLTGSVVKNSEGYPAFAVSSSREVFALVRSPYRVQRESAKKLGYRASLTVVMYRDEYDGEQYLEHNAKRYEVKEAYIRDEYLIELTCSDMRC